MNFRNGKIARLPHEIREELNQRLERSEKSPKLLAWLNDLPEVKEVLQEEFDGVPISKQNLSEWRGGGFQEWLTRWEMHDGFQEVEGFAKDVVEDKHEVPADAVATVLAVRLGNLIYKWNGEVDAKFEARSRELDRISRAVVRLQRSTHRAKKENDDFVKGLEEEDQKLREMIKKRKLEQVWGIRRELRLAPVFGGGELGKKIAKYIVQIENDVPGAELELTGDEKPDPKIVPPPPKKRTVKPTRRRRPPQSKKRKATRTRQPRVARVDKVLKEKEMENEKGRGKSPGRSKPVKPGQTDLAEPDEDGLGVGLRLGKEEASDFGVEGPENGDE